MLVVCSHTQIEMVVDKNAFEVDFINMKNPRRQDMEKKVRSDLNDNGK